MQKLTEGLGWRIDSDKPIEQVVLEAAEAYRVKYGVKPDTCLLDHRLADEPFHVDGVVVVPGYPLAGHLLIGVTNEQGTKKAS